MTSRARASGAPCDGNLGAQGESRSKAEKSRRQPGRGAPFAIAHGIDSRAREYRGRKRRHTHEFLGIPERRPERHHMIEGFIQSTESAE